MDPLQQQIARLGLAATAGYGFVLAGGNAITAHGLSARPTRDVDLFTNELAPEHFAAAVAAALAAYQAAGYRVQIRRQMPHLAQLHVRHTDGCAVEVEFAVDYRALEPAQLVIGPVLSRDDAVAAKLTALYSRAEPRDFLDVDAALATGTYSRRHLLELADARSPEPLDRPTLASQLRYGASLNANEYTDYGLTPDQIDQLRGRLREWADLLDQD